ncbi:MAG: tetratricopeptide repeat protein [Bacteroidetes bacterium]|nr:tetratricopeptide repeat protein [Bacteroidota bacterium]
MLRSTFLCFVLLLFLVFPVLTRMQAQPREELQRLESMLHAREQRGVRDSLNVRLMLDIAQEYRRSNPERSLGLARKAEGLAQTLGDHAGLAMSFTSSGITYAQQGAWVRALNYFLKSLQLKEELGDQHGMAALLSNIGVVHGRLDDEDRALRYHQRAIRYFELADDSQGLAYTYNNIGVIYLDQGHYDRAMENLLASMKLKEALGDTPGLASTYLNIGITCFMRGMMDAALENYQQSAKLYEGMRDRHGLAEAMQRIAALHLREGNAARACDIASRALRYARETNSRVVERNVLKICSDARAVLGDHAAALRFHHQYTALKDSLFNEDSSKRINEMTANYEFARRERSDRENELLRKEQRIREMELEQHATQLRQQQQNIELLNRDKKINDLQLKEQEAIVRAQRLETAEQKNKIELLNTTQKLLQRDRALKDVELEKHAWLRNMLILSSLLLAVILLLFANRYRMKKRSAQMLEERNVKLQAANTAIREHEVMLQAQAEAIAQANEELKRQNTLLEHLNTEKNELMGILSHDLRNPISTIRMLAEAIGEEGRNHEYVQRKAGQVADTADSLLVLAKNLLDINRLEAGRMQLDSAPVDVTDIIQRAAGNHRSWARTKGIVLDVEVTEQEVIAWGDDAAIMQIVDNLLSNAIKYSNTGTHVHLSIVADVDSVRIIIEDEGPGFSAGDLEKMYRKFTRLSAQPTAGEPSSGLGLSIVRKLVDSMHCDISCSSVEGKGTRFIVTLPTDIVMT